MNNVTNINHAKYLRERADSVLLMYHDSDFMEGWVRLCGTNDLAYHVLAMLEATPAYQIVIRDIDRLPDGVSVEDFYPTLSQLSDETAEHGWFRVNRETAIETVKHLIALHYDRIEDRA